MAKRFTENTKWEDTWFRKLPPKAKLFWFFILDKCDVAGFWEEDWELATFYIGEQVDESILEVFEGRIEKINGKKLWIVKFIEFQYGNLNSKVNLHKKIIGTLKQYGLWERVKKGLGKNSVRVKEGFGKGSVRVKEPLQDKDKEKDKEIIYIEKEGDCKEEGKEKIDKKQVEEFFERVWQAYPKRKGKKVGKKECWEFVKEKIKPTEWDDLLKATENYAKSDESVEGYARDPIRFLKKEYWRDWVDVELSGKIKFNEDKEFICADCKQIKQKSEREYGEDGSARCRSCHQKYIENWKKEKEMDIQKAKEDWQRLGPDQKEKRKELFRKLNIPIPAWMGGG